MEDNEKEWKTRPMLGAQRIYLQQDNQIRKLTNTNSQTEHRARTQRHNASNESRALEPGAGINRAATGRAALPHPRIPRLGTRRLSNLEG
jgi:hypothetical protein